MLAKNFKKFSILLIVTSVLMPVSLYARSSAEIAEEIRKQQEERDRASQQLKDAESRLASYEAELANSEEGIPKLEAEIRQLEAEIERNKIELDLQKKNKELKELEKEQKEIKQNSTLKTIYMDWRVESTADVKEILHSFDFKKYEQYSSVLTSSQSENIYSLSDELGKINKDIEDYESKLAELDRKNEELQQRKKELEESIKRLRYSVYATSGEISNLGAALQNADRNISELSNEQRIAQLRENEILNNTPPPNSGGGAPATPGSFSFVTQGRDLYQGHGVGMSQWGAHGFGLAGYNYQQILTFYYTGTSVTGGYQNSTINVEGYGTMNIEDYVAGQGEVPAKACGNAQQAAARPDKYVVDNPNTVWDCWPEEAIKAQVVAFRSYGLVHAGGICTTAACQVYNGTQNTRWAADETRGQVVTYGGQIANTLYSADNSQGYGTAHNDTVFQNLLGDGTPYPYLRSVNDTGIATTTSWTYWQYQTHNYTFDSVKNMIQFEANASYNDAWTRANLTAILNDIGGTITNMTFERDPSLRVKKVVLHGPNGTRTIGGWWFKNLWNNWAYDIGTYDYIYSQTFFMNTN